MRRCCSIRHRRGLRQAGGGQACQRAAAARHTSPRASPTENVGAIACRFMGIRVASTLVAPSSHSSRAQQECGAEAVRLELLFHNQSCTFGTSAEASHRGCSRGELVACLSQQQRATWA